MTTVLLIVHLFVTLALIGVVLIQRNEGGGLGIGSSQGMGSFMTGRGTANLLTRMTAVLATIFLLLSLGLALLSRGTSGVGGASILDVPPAPAPAAQGSPAGSAPSGLPVAPTPQANVPPQADAPPQANGRPQANVPPQPRPAAPAGPAVPTN